MALKPALALGALAAATTLAATVATAQVQQQGRTVAYLAFGEGSSSPYENQDDPFAFGLYHVNPLTQFLFGLDVGLEGTRVDGTYGITTLEQGLSLNVMVGRSIYDNGINAVDLGLLVGFREVAADCPTSYIGWACYANSEPEYDYDLNLGAMASVTFDQLTFGLRVTEVSKTLMLGFAF